MSMSTHVIGIVPVDEKYRQMRSVYESCETAGVQVPESVLDFFNGYPPDDRGTLVDSLVGCVRDYYSDSRAESGLEVELDKVPKHIKILRFCNSW